jgi:N-methylhydantoinase A
MALLKNGPEGKAKMRRVWFDTGWLETPVYQREALPQRFAGPAIIEQLDCTTVLEPGNSAQVDPSGNLVVSV